MNIKLISSLILLFGGMILFISANKNNTTEEVSNLSEKMNLAMRQVVHQLLTEEGDSTSLIPMVVEKSKNEYQLKINCSFNYDNLPKLMHETLIEFGIKNPYLVFMRECVSDSIYLGYSSDVLASNMLPCKGREMEQHCSNLTVQLQEIKPKISWLKYAAFASILFGIVLLLLNLFKSKPKVEEEIPEIDENKIKLGQLTYDKQNQIISLNEEQTSLTFREGKLLQFLIERKGQVLPREEILKNVWEDEGVMVGRSLDVFISRLRKILKIDPSLEIKSVHGIGYRLIEGEVPE